MAKIGLQFDDKKQSDIRQSYLRHPYFISFVMRNRAMLDVFTIIIDDCWEQACRIAVICGYLQRKFL